MELERVRRVKSGQAYYAERWIGKRGCSPEVERTTVFVEWCINKDLKRKLCVTMKGIEPVPPEPIAESGWMFWREVDPSNS